MGNGRWTIPIIQGGMGVGISLGGLAGAVAKEGGLGLISAAQIGFKEKDFKENTVKANKRAIHRELKRQMIKSYTFKKGQKLTNDIFESFLLQTK